MLTAIPWRDLVNQHVCARMCMALPAGAIGSLHLLPLYPSTGDRGFAPVTYQEVDPKFGEVSSLQHQIDSSLILIATAALKIRQIALWRPPAHRALSDGLVL